MVTNFQQRTPLPPPQNHYFYLTLMYLYTAVTKRFVFDEQKQASPG